MPKAQTFRSRPDATARREQIMAEAIGLIGRLGYYGFTVEKLAHLCGLTTAGLLYHFGTKERLLIAVLQEYELRIRAFIHDGDESGAIGPWDASLGAALDRIRAILIFNSMHPELVRLNAVLHSESLEHTHPANDHFREREVIVLREFAKALAPHCADPGSTARHIIALMDGLALQWLRADQGFDLVAEWDRAMAGILPGRAWRDGALPAT